MDIVIFNMNLTKRSAYCRVVLNVFMKRCRDTET